MDILAQAFLKLRQAFFRDDGSPIPFGLRPKRNTQDDPFDEYVVTDVLADLPNVRCVQSPGPLISPDLVLLADGVSQRTRRAALADDLRVAVAIEVKKLERSSGGAIARATGLDYNSTPPCGSVKVYDQGGADLLVRAFYLFVCMEQRGAEQALTALALVDGNLLNADLDLYLRIVGQRTKEIGLGTYGDGVNRNRPMMIFGNPLGVASWDRAATLVHPAPDLQHPGLSRCGQATRTCTNEETLSFTCYRSDADVRRQGQLGNLADPIRVPRRREETQGRGRFVLPFKLG